MCLIIAPGDNGVLLPRETFDHVFKRNDDGFGAMWVDQGRVRAFKKIGMSADEIYSMMEELAERHPDVVFHMRYKTHGQVIPGLSHPFRILHKNRHGKDMFFMHNGVLGDFGKNLNHGQSDTTVFKDKILIPLLTRNPDALDDPDVFAGIERLTQGSRLIFMDSTGKTWRTSDKSWNNRYGLTLSNTYMLPSTYTAPYTPPQYQGGPSTTIGTPPGKEVAAKNNVVPFSTAGKIWVVENGIGKWVTKDDNLDDDLPFSLQEPSASTTSTSSGDVTYHEKLRYARIIQNLHGGDVLSRVQLCGDILGMSETELYGLCKEDPDSTSIIIAELFEMFLGANSELEKFKTLQHKAISSELMVEHGASMNHRASMQKMVTLRREKYEAMVEEKRQVEEKAKRSA